MSDEQEVIDAYIQRCRIIGEKGYSRLSDQREQIKDYIKMHFSNNGYSPERISQLVSICDTATFDFLENEVMNRGSRPLHWPNYHEAEIKKRINISLQST